MVLLLPLQCGRAEYVAEAAEDFSGGIGPPDLSFLNEGNPVTLPGFIHERSGDQDGDAFFLKPGQHLPELFAGNRIYSCGGFIEEKHLRIVDQGTAKGKFLLHSAGEGTGPALTERSYLFINIPDLFIMILNGCMEYRSKEVQVFFHGQIRIEGKTSRHVAHFPADGFVVATYVSPVDAGFALVGGEQGGQNPEKSAFPGTVRTDQPEDLSPGDREGNIFQSPDGTVAFAHVADGYDCLSGIHGCSSLNRTSPYMPSLM